MGDHVVTGVGASSLDEFREVGEQVGDALGGADVALCGGGHDLFGPAVEAGSVLGWHAEVVGYHEGGERLEEPGDDVTAAGHSEPFEVFNHEGPDLVFEFGDLAGREARAHEASHGGVVRRVHEDDRGGITHLGAGRIGVHGEAVGRGEGVGVADRREDVFEAGEEPEGPGLPVGLDPVDGVVVS